jgi:hypothetical protein
MFWPAIGSMLALFVYALFIAALFIFVQAVVRISHSFAAIASSLRDIAANLQATNRTPNV